MAKKVYAVRKGHQPGVYDSWAQCETQTKGFSGAEFRGFKTEAEARAWLAEAGRDISDGVAQWKPRAEAAPDVSKEHLDVSQEVSSSQDESPPWEVGPTDGPKADGATLEREADRTAIEPAPLPTFPSQSTNGVQRDYRQELLERVNAFIDYLREQGVAAYAASGGSEFHERIGIEEGGWFDLYHTRKKPYHLLLDRLENPALKSEVEELWRAFHWGVNADDDQDASSSPWDVAEYYYKLLRPYAELRFDFIALARALHNASAEAPNPRDVRYDFTQMESFYKHARDKT